MSDKRLNFQLDLRHCTMFDLFARDSPSRSPRLRARLVFASVRLKYAKISPLFCRLINACISLLFDAPRFVCFVSVQEERLTSAADTEFKLCPTFQIIQRSCLRVRRRPEESTFVVLSTTIISFVQILASIYEKHKFQWRE